MKQETNTMQTKEGLHTQGEWVVLKDNKWPVEYKIYSKPSGWHIATLSPFSPEQEQAQANAELIVRSVNERQALLDSHRELAETLETVYSTLNNWNTARNDGIYSNLLEYIKPKLNNAKNI